MGVWWMLTRDPVLIRNTGESRSLSTSNPLPASENLNRRARGRLPRRTEQLYQQVWYCHTLINFLNIPASDLWRENLAPSAGWPEASWGPGCSRPWSCSSAAAAPSAADPESRHHVLHGGYATINQYAALVLKLRQISLNKNFNLTVSAGLVPTETPMG